MAEISKQNIEHPTSQPPPSMAIKTHPIDSDLEKSSVNDDTAPKNPNIITFDQPFDPENPMDWSSSKKTVAITLVTVMTVLSPIGSTICSAATLQILSHFQSTNSTLGSFITTVYLLGYTFGPIVIAPLSELYGRAYLYKICITLFVVFNVACAVAPSLGALIAFRFFAGVMGSCPITVGTGSIADMVPAEKRAAAMGAYVLGTVFGPSIGPIIGGYLAPAAGWRWTFWILAIMSGVVTIPVFLFVQESYPYVILQRKTERMRKETGNHELHSALDTGKTPRDLFAFSILRPLKMLFFSPIVFALALYAAVVYSYLYLCFTTFEVVFGKQYGFSGGEAGLATLGLGIGSIIGVVAYSATANKISSTLAERNGGDAKPEYRLPPMVLGAIFTPIGLFWYGWAAEVKAHWIVPILGSGFIGLGLIFTFMASTVYLVDVYTVHAASVTASATILRCLFGALLPLAGPSMFEALGLGWGNSLLGFIAVAFIPLPFVFYFYGQRMRESKLIKVEF